jgi:hypothetical protein
MIHRFKYDNFIMPVSDVKVFCALFYGIEEYNNIIYSKKVLFNEEKLKHYLPKSKWNYISSDFIKDVKEIVEKQVIYCEKVITLYRCVIRQFGDKTGWLTYYFKVVNTQPTSLTGHNTHLVIGVSHKRVSVSPPNSNALLLEFTFNDLKYIVSGDSLFIQTENRDYRFTGINLLFFHKIVMIYKTLQAIQ